MIQSNNSECQICLNTLNNSNFIVKELMLGIKDEFEYFECSECNCLQIKEIPNKISSYYPPESYYSFNTNTTNKNNGVKSGIANSVLLANIFPNSYFKKFISFFLKNKKVSFLNSYINQIDAKILDVGCGNGMKFLYPLKEAGFNNVIGCDPFISENLTYENGLKILKKNLLEVDGSWDAVCFNHSFEHVENPKEILEKVFELLSDDGICIIRIPTTSSFAWKHYGVNWFQLDAPRHIFLHSIESIELLVKQTGLVLEKVEYDSTHHQFTISERYKQGKSLKERNYNNSFERLLSVFKKLRNSRKAKKLNNESRGDQAIFYIRKNKVRYNN